MSDKDVSVDAPTTDEVDLRAEVQRLRQENVELAKKLDDSGAISPRARHSLALVLVVIGSLLASLSIPAVWVNRMLNDTDVWVETMAPLAREPAIQGAVAEAVSTAILDAIEVRPLVEQYLPEQAQPLAAPITAAVDNFVRQQTLTFTRSDLFARAWVETNRVTHAAAVRIITEGEGGVLANQGSVMSVQIGPLAEAIKQRLVERGLGIAANIPTENIDREVVIFQSPRLAQATRGVNLLSRLAFWIPGLALVALAGAIAMARDKSRGALWAGVGVLLATFIPLQAISIGRIPIVRYFEGFGARPGAAASAAYSIIFRDLITAEQTLALISLVVIAGAILAGPSRTAVAFREVLSGGLTTLSARFSFGRFGEFVAQNKSVLRSVGLFAAVIAGILPVRRGIDLGPLIWAVVLLLLWLAAIEFFGAGASVAKRPEVAVEEATAPPGGDAADDAGAAPS